MRGELICMAVLVTSALPLANTFGHEPILLKPEEILVEDGFAEAKKKGRRAVRGDWQFADGVAKCTQDDELYEKFKNHGPVIWYGQGFTNAVIEFEIRASEVKNFVFTINGSHGHVFRFVMNERGTGIRAWDADHKSRAVVTGGPKLVQDTWIPVTVELAGKQAALQIGPDYSVKVEDPSYAAAKTVVGLGFSFGALQIRDFKLTKGKAH